MKRLKFTIALLLTAAFLLISAACSGETLRTPGGFAVDNTDRLTWSAVADARGYDVEILKSDGTLTEEHPRRAYVDLAVLSEGDYDIRVRSVGGANNNIYSEWSEVIAFHREHESGMTYRLINNGTEYAIRSVGSAEGDLSIAPTYRGKPVTEIGKAAFRSNTRVTSVELPDTVRNIAENAFYNCSELKSVTIPASVKTIGDYAFYGCNGLTEVVLPDSVTEIASYLFAYCRSLSSITFGNGVTSIGESAFYSCDALSEIDIPDTVTEIGSYAFSLADGLQKVTFGSNVTSLDAGAFYACAALRTIEFRTLAGGLVLGEDAFRNCTALASVDLPDGVVEIGTTCFRGCTALKEVTISETVEKVGAYAFEDTGLMKEQQDAGEGFFYAGDWLVGISDEFYGTVAGEGLGEIVTSGSEEDGAYGKVRRLRDGTIGIADQAFVRVVTDGENVTYSGCIQLAGFYIADTIRYIGDYAFYSTPRLRTVIGEAASGGHALVSLGMGAFASCPLLNNVRLPRGLRSIGAGAFSGCALLNVTESAPQALVPATVTHIGSGAFSGTAVWNNANSNDPTQAGIVTIADWVVGVNNYFQTFTPDIKSGTKGIADYAFSGLMISSVTGLTDVQYIGMGAFYNCQLLMTANLGPDLVRIEPYTFFNCAALTSVGTWLMSLESIGDCAFSNCLSLASLDFSNTELREIGDYAFYTSPDVPFQTSLQSVNFGEKLETIGDYAFYNSRSLGINLRDGSVVPIVLPDSLRSIGTRAFGYCISLREIDLGNGLEEIADYAFRNSPAITAIKIPASVKKVGNYAFYQCIGISTLTFEEGEDGGTEEIGDYAFYGLTSLKEVSLPSGLQRIGDFAFKGCSLLSAAVLRGSPEYVGRNAFYGCERLTIYAVGEGDDGWRESWNSSYRTVFWSITLSDDGTYVASVTGAPDEPFVRFGVSAPVRAGYDFVGWAETPDATEAKYGPNETFLAEAGVTLYSVWRASAENE